MNLSRVGFLQKNGYVEMLASASLSITAVTTSGEKVGGRRRTKTNTAIRNADLLIAALTVRLRLQVLLRKHSVTPIIRS